MNSLTLTPRHALGPWSIIDGIDEEMNRLFGKAGSERRFSLAIDLVETETDFEIHADVPGIAKEEIRIEVADDVITIKGQRAKEETTNERNAHRIERSYGSFQRAFEIPGGFEHENVEAKFTDGVLKITLPKLKEKQPKRIEVKT